MERSTDRSVHSLFYLLWLLLGLVQAGNTELLDDEAYYWVFSQHLDWGYFDHPPMTALLVRAGYWIFPNELGVRLLCVLLSTGTIWLIEKITIRTAPRVFYSIVLSMIAFQLGGFLAVPDIPLLFFTALFFFRYDRFLKNQSWFNTIWLGVCAAFLIYSKYHGILILFFTLISNVRLFRSARVYVAGILALVLFVPHLWWQYQHDFVSFRYHLQESNVNPYKVSYTIEYLVGQILLPGPLIGLLLLPAAWLYRVNYPFERSLRFTAIGIYVFFLLSSFRGRVEGNWTAPALISLLVLAHAYISENAHWQKWMYRLLPASILLILVLRVSLMVDVIPAKGISSRFHSWKNWPDTLKKRTKGLPVVWLNSYQRGSKYAFYAQQTTHSLTFYRERRNNYNFWPIEDSLQNKVVVIADIYDMQRFTDSIQTPIGWVGYRIDSSFQGTSKYWFEPFSHTIEARSGDSIRFRGEFLVPPSGGKTESCRIGVFQNGKWLEDWNLPSEIVYPSSDGAYFNTTIKQSLPPGNYTLVFALNARGLPPTHNSRKIQLTIRK
ncbi:MAG: ArnT family glycosyltransferase [Bacteroidota bacterium]